MRLVSAAQMRALDAEAINGLTIPGAVLMESAGRGVVAALWALDGAGRINLRGGRALVVAGPGNNGADGVVVARYLHAAGVSVRVLLCAAAERLQGDAALQWKIASALGVDLATGYDPATVAAATAALGPRDVIIDALLGTGLSRAVRGELAQVIAALNASPARRVSVDVPSGLDADLGAPPDAAADPAGPAAIVRADDTVTFGWAKLGLVGDPGFRSAGHVQVVDIGIPEVLADRLGVATWLLGPALLAPLSAPRPPAGHKGSHGHLLIIAGSPGKTGAALLACRGAQAAGVGLCTIAAPAAAQSALQAQVLEAMTLAYPDSAPGLGDAWLAAAEGKRAVAIGPGLPTGPTSQIVRTAVLQLLAEVRPATWLVLDAEALNLLEGDLAPLRAAAGRGVALVLTPHPGEAARLLHSDTATIQASRLPTAQRLARESGAVALLKGARTVIAHPDGRAWLCPTGNAGMGVGGMGDVLTGMIGALLCSGLSPDAGSASLGLHPDDGAAFAACAGAYWHGLAGDALLRRRFPAALLLAGELCAALPEAVQWAQRLQQTAPRGLQRPLLPVIPAPVTLAATTDLHDHPEAT